MEYLKDNQEAAKWFHKAAEIAINALCLNAKCGAVIVKGGEVIGEGYNAPPQDEEANRMCNKEVRNNKLKYDKTCCIHAEWRAIMDALKNNPEKIPGSKLYFVRVNENGEIQKSGKPYCTVCSRLALDVGVEKFLLWHEEGICEYDTREYNKLSYDYTE